MHKRKAFMETLMDRDGLSEAEAMEAHQQVVEFMDELIDSGGGLDELEEYLRAEFGLEGDYVEDFM